MMPEFHLPTQLRLAIGLPCTVSTLLLALTWLDHATPSTSESAQSAEQSVEPQGERFTWSFPAEHLQPRSDVRQLVREARIDEKNIADTWKTLHEQMGKRLDEEEQKKLAKQRQESIDKLKSEIASREQERDDLSKHLDEIAGEIRRLEAEKQSLNDTYFDLKLKGTERQNTQKRLQYELAILQNQIDRLNKVITMICGDTSPEKKRKELETLASPQKFNPGGNGYTFDAKQFTKMADEAAITKTKLKQTLQTLTLAQQRRDEVQQAIRLLEQSTNSSESGNPALIEETYKSQLNLLDGQIKEWEQRKENVSRDLRRCEKELRDIRKQFDMLHSSAKISTPQ